MEGLCDLHTFCERIAEKYGSFTDISEEDLAQEFRDTYLRNGPLDMRALRKMASACGIQIQGSQRLPKNVRGYHEVYDGRRFIYYRIGDTRSGIENTILHEFREMIEPVFAEVNEGYQPLHPNKAHLVANQFATAVLLPRGEFRDHVYATGFDVIELSRFFQKSCAQVLLRMGEVIKGKLFLYGALYEGNGSIDSWKLNYRTESSNKINPEANVLGRNGFFPKRGRAIDAGSLVDIAVRHRKPHLAERITFRENWDEEWLVAIARPLVVRGAPVKAALVVLNGLDRDLITSQVERIKPIVVDNFYRHL